MTSKEALEEIRDFRYGENKLLVCQTEMNDIIKEDLECLEKLENKKLLDKLKWFIDLISDLFFIDLIEREDGSYKFGFEPKNSVEGQSRFVELDYKVGNLLEELLKEVKENKNLL